ncbi:SAM-dependent methyltransferase [Arthrobacter sp. MYb224]|uniref:class I SAM-dependent methyltransferase n=1 Tax=Micrococcaceae TaxID=1268 RepID=UPI000CFB1F2A|nr:MULTISPECIES: class I SAM-dependent methyltransferase [unclassified Arthrobacter]PQZ97535.1 SAM-dependent methyltransferase [Arthrobacter sp. MYb224]PRA04235.1 SAM-dependent methyltransferase [Arthrobacter sp. MYb229]PRB51854.1 SAM-dependent methyltransferase [Arthrobacter sp. MYb216]
MHEHHHTTAPDAVAFWESHYGQSERIWSGNVNKMLAEIVADLPSGRSLDFGCGEGADTIWLANKGWQATGVDISATAVERARSAAKEQGLSEKDASFIAEDLTTWDSEERFDLVTLSFFQAPFEIPRAEIMQKAASLVAPGGHLLAVSHAAAPSWASNEQMAQHRFPTPDSELESLSLDSNAWTILRAEIVEREVTDPDGKPATLEDTVVFVQRGN